MFTAAHDRSYDLADGASSPRSSAVRGAAIAAALAAGYCAFAAILIGAAVWVAAAEMVRPDAAPGRILLAVVAAALVLWTVLPRRDGFEPPGPRVSREDEPALFGTIENVARKTGQQMPGEVYLVNDVGASIASRGGIAGFGSRRVLLLGLPLLEAVSVQELEAVLAHEFGHHQDGGVPLGAWIHRTRTSLRTSMPDRRFAAATLYAWYTHLFLRLTCDVATRQELQADGTAARVAGGASVISALRTIHAVSMAYRTYVHQELQPVLQRGYLPPVGDGFRRFLAAPGMTDYLDAVVRCDAAFGEPDSFDAHPPLKVRIAGLEGLPQVSAGQTQRASSLLTDVIQWEHAVFRTLGTWGWLQFQPVEWDQVAEAVYVPLWRERVDCHGHLLRGRTLGTLPTTSAEFVSLGSRISRPHGETPAERASIDRAGHLVLAAIAVRLAELGWSVTALPGEETVLRRDGHELRPYSELRAVIDGRVPASWWRERCIGAGIADVPVWGAARGPTTT